MEGLRAVASLLAAGAALAAGCATPTVCLPAGSTPPSNSPSDKCAASVLSARRAPTPSHEPAPPATSAIALPPLEQSPPPPTVADKPGWNAVRLVDYVPQKSANQPKLVILPPGFPSADNPPVVPP